FFHPPTLTHHTFTRSLHDALPISGTFAQHAQPVAQILPKGFQMMSQSRLLPSPSDSEQLHTPRQNSKSETMSNVPNCYDTSGPRDRKSTRLNSSHEWISYAVFCLK